LRDNDFGNAVVVFGIKTQGALSDAEVVSASCLQAATSVLTLPQTHTKHTLVAGRHVSLYSMKIYDAVARKSRHKITFVC
jgi:hypothetical protein